MDKSYLSSLSLTNSLFLVAGLTVLPRIFSLLEFCRIHLRASSLSKYLRKDKSTATSQDGNSSWALVTGASDGIGYGFATELASQGFNVILHGRNSSKLDDKISALKKQHPNVKYRKFVLDASVRGNWDQIEGFVKTIDEEGLRVTVLVNNVGGGAAWADSKDQTVDEINALIDMNANFPAQITAAMIPVLKKNQPSLIMNVSSAVAVSGIPYLSIYCGSKGFNYSWSNSLRNELLASEGMKIEVLCLIVGAVQSAGTGMNEATLFMPTSRTFAKRALHKVGCGRDYVTPYAPHALQLGFLHSLPLWLSTKLFIDIGRKSRAQLKRKDE